MNREEQRILERALELASNVERSAFLDGACLGNQELRAKLDALLTDGDGTASFKISVNPAPLKASDSLEEVGPKVGRYKLLQKIGEGGFGVVYMAEQKAPVKRRVALKILKLGMDTKQVVARFEAERQALALMDHPNVARVLDAGATDKGRPFFVMELVKGVRITDYCDDKHLPTKERLELFIPVCRAVQHAHTKGIIHRDIKPSNILVTLHDGVPVPKVIDFGIAKATQQELTEKTLFTEFGQMIGTPAYMSPEQAEMSGLDVDTRTDIYSLGVLLYELLVGHTPIDVRELKQGGYDEIRRRIKEDEPAKPSTRVSSLMGDRQSTVAKNRSVAPQQLSRELRGDLDWIVLKALEKDRTRRYDTAIGFAEDILRHLDNEPVLAAAPTTSYRLRSYVRRHRAALSVAATIIVLLVVGIVSTSLLAFSERRARVSEKEKAEELARRETQLESALTDAALAQQSAERRAYYANMTLADSYWNQGAIARLARVLDETADFPNRGIEWFYWHGRLHEEVRTLNPGIGPIQEIQVSPDGHELVLSTHFERYFLDAASCDVRTVHGNCPISRDGRWVAGRTALINTSTGGRTPLTMPGTMSERRRGALSPNGDLLARSYFEADELRVWNTRDNEQSFVAPGFSWGHFSPDGELFVAGSYGDKHKIAVWSTDNWSPIAEIEVDSGDVQKFTADSRFVVLDDSYSNGEIRLLDARDLSIAKTVKTVNADAVALSPDGSYFAHADVGGKIVIRSMARDRIVATYRGHRSKVSGLVFTPDSRQLISASPDGSVKFWSVVRNDFLRVGEPENQARAPFLSANGSRLVVSSGSQAHLVDVDSGEMISSIDDIVLAFITADGKRIIANRRMDANNWAIVVANENGTELRRFEVGEGIRGIGVHERGDRVNFGTNSKFSLLDLNTGKEILTVPASEGRIDGAGFCLNDNMYVAFQHEVRFYSAATGQEKGSFNWKSAVSQRWSELSPDGMRLVLATTRASTSSAGIVIYDVETRKILVEIDGVADRTNLVFFSPDGRRLISDTGDGRLKIWDAETGYDLGTIQRENARRFRDFAISRNGRRIAIGGRGGVWIQEIPTSEQVADWARTDLEENSPRDVDWWQKCGAIQDWLVLAPIPVDVDDTPEQKVNKKLIPNEANLRPTTGSTFRIGGRKLAWKEYHSESWKLDFDTAIGAPHDHAGGYAVSYIYSDLPQNDVRLLIGMDDFARFYLNGKQVYEAQELGRALLPGDDEVKVGLKKGENILVVKVIDQASDWGTCVQLVDATYKPLLGVEVRARPK